MGRKAFFYWTGEFLCVTAIAIILATSIEAIWIGLPAIFLIFLKYLQYRAYILDKYFAIRMQLDVLEELLPLRERDLRCTYHVPERIPFRRPRKLVQVIDYVPRGGGRGRKFSTKKGIIGRVYRDGGARVENFSNEEEYRERMVSDYGYTVEEMGERTNDRRSYLCVPVVEGATNRVLGLIYFDSNEYRTFTLDEDNENWCMIQSAAESIKRTITS